MPLMVFVNFSVIELFLIINKNCIAYMIMYRMIIANKTLSDPQKVSSQFATPLVPRFIVVWTLI